MRAIAAITVILAAAGCSGPYHDLESSFKNDQQSTSRLLPLKKVILIGTKRADAENYNDVLGVKLSSDAIYIEPTARIHFGIHNVKIPINAVSGCSLSCFAGGEYWEVDLLIAKTGTLISVPKSTDVLEWCWPQHIPMVSGPDKRDWLYKGSKLPDSSNQIEQFSSYKRYAAQMNGACKDF